MRITWKLDKKRGNYRPTLTYTMVLEDFEREMAVDSINILSLLPKINNSHEAYCLPGTHERVEGWQPRDYHFISTPYFKDGQAKGSLRLPFRESGEYPEIVESFALLTHRHEARVRETYGWQPLAKRGELDLSDETREAIAATLTARKLLAFC